MRVSPPGHKAVRLSRREVKKVLIDNAITASEGAAGARAPYRKIHVTTHELRLNNVMIKWEINPTRMPGLAAPVKIVDQLCHS